MTATEPRPKRSPLKRKPLRQAGQSVDSSMRDLIDDRMAEVATAISALLLMISEWSHFWFDPRPHPWLATIFALPLAAWAGLRCRKALRVLRRMKQGRDGERIAGESLEKLRAYGYEIFHDIVAGNFNIDHVLVGPSGIYALETKTLSKRGGVEEKAECDGESILIRGMSLPDNPIPQAKGNARWFADYLYETTATRFRVKPVVLMPGWFVVNRAKPCDLLFLNAHENSLKRWIVDQPETLSKADRALVSSRLSILLPK